MKIKPKKENRGGRREGAGRHKIIKNHSEKVKKNYEKAAAKILKETGMTVEEHFLRAALDPDLHAGSRAAFAKLYNEALLVKESKQTVEQVDKPKIYLPADRPSSVSKIKEEEEARIH